MRRCSRATRSAPARSSQRRASIHPRECCIRCASDARLAVRIDMPPARTALTALTVPLAIQMYVSFAASESAVLAHEIAREFDVQTRWVGAYVAIVYAGAMFSSLASGGFIERN